MRGIVIASVVVLSACGASKRAGVSRFPDASKLEEVALDPLPPGEPPEVADVDEWTLAGPFAAKHGGEPLRAPDAWDALLDGRAKNEAMRCVAREIARFRVQNGAGPSSDLEQFIAARCGAAVAEVIVSTQETDVPRLIADDALLQGASDGVKRAVEQLLAVVPNADLGIALARNDTRAVIVVAGGQRKAEIAPVPFAPDGRKVRIEGTMLEPAQQVYAVTTRGKLGAAACDHDPAAQPPRFAFTCEVDPADAETRIDVSATPEGRLLAYHVASFVVYPGTPATRWARATLAPASGETAVAIVSAVNTIRAKGGIAPVRLAEAQTRILGKVAPHWFASVWGTANHHEEREADVMALGIMAGWRVDGDVMQGRLTSAWVPHSGDPARLVASAIEWPAGRAVLLDPEIDALAVGTVSGGKRPVLAAVVAGYSLREKEEQAALVGAIGSKLPEGAKRLATFDEDARDSAEKIESGKDPHEVLRVLMKKSSTKLSRGVRGWVIETQELDEMQVPSELAQERGLEWIGSVAWRRPEGEPWGRYVVLLVAPQ